MPLMYFYTENYFLCFVGSSKNAEMYKERNEFECVRRSLRHQMTELEVDLERQGQELTNGLRFFLQFILVFNYAFSQAILCNAGTEHHLSFPRLTF